MDIVIKKVYDTIVNNNMILDSDRVLVGFSGGADSLFLILSLIEVKKYIDFEIYAAHLNHGIRGAEAKNDEDFVTEFCKLKNITLYKTNVDIPSISKNEKVSEETAGRNERYKFFNTICKENNINKIAVAHNMNDSVETVILNMIRGSSLNGLCGIKPVNNNIIRPIISVKRDEIECYLNKNSQNYCVDSTNLMQIYARNKVRNSILKSMLDINPSVIETIYSNIQNLKSDDDFIKTYTQKLKCIALDGNNIIINRGIFELQHNAIKNRIILDAYSKITGDICGITSYHLSIFNSELSAGKKYNFPNGVIACVSFDSIVFSKNQIASNEFYYNYKIGDNLEYINGCRINVSHCNCFDKNDTEALYIDADMIKNKTLTIRSRIDGDRFIPFGMKSNKKLKQLFIELKIPVWERNDIPLVVDGDEIVAVVPYRISELYKITEKTKNIIKIQITKENN